MRLTFNLFYTASLTAACIFLSVTECFPSWTSAIRFSFCLPFLSLLSLFFSFAHTFLYRPLFLLFFLVLVSTPMYTFLPFAPLFLSLGLCPHSIFCGWRSDKCYWCQKLAPKHNYNHTPTTREHLSASIPVQRSYQGNNFINITFPWPSSSRPGPDPWISHASSSSSEEPGSAWPTPHTSSLGTGHLVSLWHSFLIWQKCGKPKRAVPREKSRPGITSWLMLWYIIPLKSFCFYFCFLF